MGIRWSEEELREMAEADEAISRECVVDLELSRRLDLAARDQRRDDKSRRQRAWMREYYRKYPERFAAYRKAYWERHGAERNEARRKNPECRARHRAQSHDYYERNREEILRRQRERRAKKKQEKQEGGDAQ